MHPVADIVCGGYFTAVLTTIGEVWMKGWGGWRQIRMSSHLTASDLHRQHISTITQISAARDGVICLAESAVMWYCHLEELEAHMVTTGIRVMKGGWTGLSAMRTPRPAQEEDSGILVWTSLDGIIKHIPTAIPMTSPHRPDYAGEVINWAMMRDYVLFVTRPGRVWAWHIAPYAANATQVALPVELKRGDDAAHEDVADVCGWLERFALMMRNGEVLLGTTQMLKDYLDLGTPLKFEKIPALQNTGVVKIAFGDWHYHALHKDGTITSYGHEPEGCGAFGLGDVNLSVMERGFSRDIVIRPECLTTGRRVHFEPEKQAWQLDLARSYTNDDQADVSWPGDGTRYEVSEWIEERLRAWATPGNEVMIAPGHRAAGQEGSYHGARQDDTKRDEDPAYFVTSVAACGWHTVALVLVDTAKATEVARRYAEVQRDGAWAAPPRLQLLNGEEMPGSDLLRTWSRASGCPKPKPVEIIRW